MKYIPGSAKFVISKTNKPKLRNIYTVEVSCDANDGDYISDSWEQNEFDEVEILMIAYLLLNSYSIPKNWKDTINAAKKDCNYAFGGTYLADNNRFDREGDEHYDSWIESWASESNYILFAGMMDSMCHSVCTINITYYDKNGVGHACKAPDLGKLFDSEDEFINYVRDLYDSFSYNEDYDED